METNFKIRNLILWDNLGYSQHNIKIFPYLLTTIDNSNF
jgi:hypothetical protein